MTVIAPTITVVVVDDHDSVREAASALLSESPNISVIGEARNGSEAVDRVLATNPDVVLMDLRMPVMDGVEATRELSLRSPATAVLIHSAYDDESLVFDALQAGARGYVVKGSSGSDIAEALAHVASGQSHISDEIARPIIDRLRATVATERAARIAAEEAAARLVQLVAQRREFAIQSSHELRTPITLLLGNLEMLVDSAVGGERQIAQAAMRGAKRLQYLAADLEITASSELITFAAVPVLVRSVVAHVVGELDAHGQVVTEERDDRKALADGPRLVHALRNVVRNALSVSGVTRVTIRSSTEDGRVNIDVIDDGPGFPDAVLHVLFDQFAHRDGASSGLGVGLWVTAELISRMDGEAQAWNNGDRGATVRLQLPAATS